MKSSATPQMKSNPPTRRRAGSHPRRGFHRRRRFHPPARVDLVEKAPRRVLFLAEEKGFEPLQRFHALRDFESRIFDQLEYSSVTDSLYQLPEEKSIIFFMLPGLSPVQPHVPSAETGPSADPVGGLLNKDPKASPSRGGGPATAGSEGWDVTVSNMPEITDISQQPTFHPSVACGDSSPPGEPCRDFFDTLPGPWLILPR